MASYASKRDPGAFGTCAVAFLPQAGGATARMEGPAIDRNQVIGDLKSAVACLIAGAATGTPTGVAATLVLEHNDAEADGASWAVYPDVAGSTAGVAVAAASSTSAQARWDLTGAKKWVRFVVTNALTAGSSPTLQVGVSGFLASGDL